MEIIINTEPAITASRPGRLIGIGTIRSGLSPNSENANCQITLDNGDGYYSRLFANPPLGSAVLVTDCGMDVFSGVITVIDLDAACTVTLEA